MVFINKENKPLDYSLEADERFLVKKYIPADATVLELGARYGTVSCVLSKLLNDPTKHVAVEPDARVIEALKKNKENNDGHFHIYEGVVSENGYKMGYIDSSFDLYEYGTYTVKTDEPTVENMSLDSLSKKYNLNFDCVVADCEGFFPTFVEENPEAIKNMRVIIYEQDGNPWSEFEKKYKIVSDILTEYNFKRIHTIPHKKYTNNPNFHNVWINLKFIK